MNLDPRKTLRCIKIEWMIIGFGFGLILIVLGFCAWRTWVMDNVIIEREGMVNKVLQNQEKMIDQQCKILTLLEGRK